MRLCLKDRHADNTFPEIALRFENSFLRSVLGHFVRLAHGLVHLKTNYFTSRNTKFIDFIEKNLNLSIFNKEIAKKTLKCHKMKITYPISKFSSRQMSSKSLAPI